MPFLSSLLEDRMEDGKREPRFDLSNVSSVVERRNTNGEKPTLCALSFPTFSSFSMSFRTLRFAAIFSHITPTSNNTAIECEFISYTFPISRSSIAIKHVSLQLYVTHFLANHVHASLPRPFQFSRDFFSSSMYGEKKEKKEEKEIRRTNLCNRALTCKLYRKYVFRDRY